MRVVQKCLPLICKNGADRQTEISLVNHYSRCSTKQVLNRRFVRYLSERSDWVKMMVLDIDRPFAFEDWIDKLPQPNLIVVNPVNGHSQYLYLLKEAAIDNLKGYWNIRKEMNSLVAGDDNHFRNFRSPYLIPNNRNTRCLKRGVYQQPYSIVIEYSFDLISLNDIELFLTTNNPFFNASLLASFPHSHSPTLPDMVCTSYKDEKRKRQGALPDMVCTRLEDISVCTRLEDISVCTSSNPCTDMVCTRLEDLPYFEPVPEGSRNITMVAKVKPYIWKIYNPTLAAEDVIKGLFQVYKHFSSGLADQEIMDTAIGTYEWQKKEYNPMKSRNTEIQRQRIEKRWINNGESIRKAAIRLKHAYPVNAYTR